MSELQPNPESLSEQQITAYDLFTGASYLLLEYGEPHGDRMQYEFTMDDGRRFILHNYATSAAHILHHKNNSLDPTRIESLRNGESIITAVIHDDMENTIRSYIIFRPMDIKRSTIFSHTIGEQVLNQLPQDIFTVLDTEHVGRAEEIEVTAHHIKELLKYI